jgi:cell division protease FtsH
LNDLGKNLLLWLIIAAVLLTVFNNFSVKPEPQEMSYSSFVAEVQQDQVSDVAIDGLVIVGKTKSGETGHPPPIDDPKLMTISSTTVSASGVSRRSSRASGRSC